jgi:translation elongation factor P
MKATNIRKGQVLKVNNVLYRVLNMDHVTPGKGRAHVQTKLRSLIDGTQTEIRFRSTDDVEKAYLETKEMQFLYSDQDGYHFMDSETYDQIQLGTDMLGDNVLYLLPETNVTVQTHEGAAIGVELPPVVGRTPPRRPSESRRSSRRGSSFRSPRSSTRARYCGSTPSTAVTRSAQSSVSGNAQPTV